MNTRRHRACRPQKSPRRRFILELLEDRRLLAALDEGPEFLVNNSTPGTQVTYAETRAVGGNIAGEYIVAFSGMGPGDMQGVFARRFDATNTPLGNQFLVNATTTGNQLEPSAAMGAGGESVVAWSGKGVGDSDGGVFIRLFDNTGTAISGEIRVNQTIPSFQINPIVAKAADGSFIVTWSGKGVGDPDVGVYARRYASNGVPLTGEFRVNTTTSGYQQQSDVTIGADGSFVITWSGEGPGDVKGIFFQRFNSAGNPVGPETRANTTVDGGQLLPSVGIDGANNFSIVWSGMGAGDMRGVFMQRFNATGTPVGGEQLVNTTTLYDQEDASISMPPSGKAVVTWTSNYQDGTRLGVYGQEYDAAGVKDGGEFLINTTTAGDQHFSSVAMRDESHFTVVWSGRGVGDETGVFARSYFRNQPPQIVSDGGGDTANLNADENQTFVTDVNSTDPDGDVEGAGLTYTITGGADSTLFSVDTNTGFLTFNSAPDFENPTDSGADGTYEVEVTVTDSGGLTDSQLISVTVDDVNDAPVITSDGGGVTASVNADENQTSVTTVTATDEDLPAQSLSFTITGGADAGLFNIGLATGVLSFNVAPDFENPTDFDADGIYEVEVTVTDNGVPNLSDIQDIFVTVDNVNEAPIITSYGGLPTATDTIPENATNVEDIESIDPDGTLEGAGGLTYSITGGADSAYFSIQVNTGILVFSIAPDFENPQDAGGDNIYDVQVTVTDPGLLTDTVDIAIEVTDVNEAPVITSDGGGVTASLNVDENTTAVTTGTATDVDLPAQTLTWTITGGADQLLFGITAGGILTFNAAPDFENPADFDLDNVYDVQITVTDDGIPNMSDVQDIAVTVDNVNEAPIITSYGGLATATDSIPENATNIENIESIDPDGTLEGAGGLTYSISGGVDSAFFSIQSTTGILVFNSGRDFENPEDAGADNIYDVQVTVTDPGLLTDTVDIAVEVTDVNEAPVITSDGGGATANVNVPENTTAVTTGTATDEDLPAQTLTWTITGGADALLFGITPGGILTFNAAPDFENPTDSGGDNVYDVEVTVTDNGAPNLSDVQAIAVTVTDLDPESTAVDDTYAGIIGNVGLDVPAANGLLSNDSGGPAAVTEVNGNAGLVGNAAATTGGGTVTVQANGSFLYEPSAGSLAADSFTYELDNATTATVNLTFGTDLIWFIDVTPSGAGNAGTLSDPFNSITGYDGVAVAGDSVFIAQGSYTGPLNLDNNTIVIGEGASGVTAALLGVTEPTDSRTLPSVGGTAPVITSAANGINLAQNNTIRGLDIGNTTGTGISGTSVGTATVSDVSITGTGAGVNITTGTLAMSFDEISSSNAAGITLSGVNGDFDVTTGTIDSGASTAVSISGSPIELGVTLTSVSVNGAPHGINLNNTTGSFTVTGDGGGTKNQSGGHIQNTTDDGISLTNATNISITQLNITDAAGADATVADEHAININGVTGFTFQDAVVNGANSDDDEHLIKILNLYGGSNLIEDVQFVDINEDAIEYYNDTADDGSRDILTVRRGDFDNHFSGGEHGIDARSSGSALMGLIVDDSTFDINANGSLGINAASTGGSNFSLQILGSIFNASNAFGSGGIQVINGGTSTASNTITGNQIIDTGFTAIIVNNDDNATSSATISSNIISGDNTDGHNGFGIQIRQDENGVQTVLIDGNTITDVNFGGIFLSSRDRTSVAAGTGVLNATVTNNNVTVRDTSAGSMLSFGPALAGDAQDSNTLNLSASGNTLSGSETFGPGMGDDDILLNQQDTATFNVEQASEAALLAANTADSILTFGTITYGAAAPPTPLLAPSLGSGVGLTPLTQSQLQATVNEAIARWQAQGLDAIDQNLLNVATFYITDLPDNQLGNTFVTRIDIDPLAAGHGWATPDNPLGGRIDLLTVLSHELGHALGLPDLYSSDTTQDLMHGFLDAGTRRAANGSFSQLGALSSSMLFSAGDVALGLLDTPSSFLTLLSQKDRDDELSIAGMLAITGNRKHRSISSGQANAQTQTKTYQSIMDELMAQLHQEDESTEVDETLLDSLTQR